MPGRPGRKAFPEPGMRLVRLACSAQGRGPSGAARPDSPHSPAPTGALSSPTPAQAAAHPEVNPFPKVPRQESHKPPGRPQPTYYLSKHLVSGSLPAKDRKFTNTPLCTPPSHLTSTLSQTQTHEHISVPNATATQESSA